LPTNEQTDRETAMHRETDRQTQRRTDMVQKRNLPHEAVVVTELDFSDADDTA